jgi:uncharacterized DUF497 family protein
MFMASPRDPLEGLEGFEWDAANVDKLWHRHRVTVPEVEEAFRNRPLLVVGDLRHSHQEERFQALGRTEASRFLFLVFTLRGPRIRVLSARPMNRKERALYAEATQENA